MISKPLLPVFRIAPAPALRFEPVRAMVSTVAPVVPLSPRFLFVRKLQRAISRAPAATDSNQMTS